MNNDNQEFYTVRGYELLEQGKKDKKMLTSAMEDYLEMIYRHSSQDGYIRINLLSELLNVKPSSATKMVQKLASLGLLDYKKYDIILLTEKGKLIGEYLLRRHSIIEKFLKNIGVKENILAQTELIEHNVKDNTLNSIHLLNSVFEDHPAILKKYIDYKNKKINDL